VVERFPALALGSDPVRTDQFILRGYKSLPITVSPATASPAPTADLRPVPAGETRPGVLPVPAGDVRPDVLPAPAGETRAGVLPAPARDVLTGGGTSDASG
jgi:hypothetical protein